MKKLVGVVLLLLILGNIVAPVVAAKTIGESYARSSRSGVIAIPSEKKGSVKPGLQYKKVRIVKFDPALENMTPYWIIIAAGASEKGRKAVFEYVELSKNLTEKEKVMLKESIKRMWKKYKVVEVKRENTTLITLLRKSPATVTKNEEIVLEKIAQAVNEYFKKYTNKNVGVRWFIDVHQDMIYIACRKWGIDSNLCEIARDHADDPDFWYQVPPPPGYPDWMWNFTMQVVHSWTHYYNPSYCLPTNPPNPPVCFPAGGAPGEVKTYANKARSLYSSGKHDLAFENLGYASHFLTDVGNPFHTGAELKQYFLGGFGAIHYAYENYVSSNWNSGYWFRDVVSGVPVHHYVPIIDPEEATKDLAGYSHMYSNALFWEIFLNPSNWESSDTVKVITENCLRETMRYTLGLVEYVR